MEIENLKNAIININASLYYYEKDYVSLKRTPYGEKERIESFNQYIECRLNYECFNIPELSEYIEDFNGYLFKITLIKNQNDLKKRFSLVYAELIDPLECNEIYTGERDPNEVINEIRTILGGNKIKFNYSQKKTKIEIE